MKIQLSIIIVNFNVKYFLEHCLNSVLKATCKIKAEIIVVDNQSTDGSREYFYNRFPGVIFRWNKVNVGFAKANNMGLGMASGEYVLFLNPDTIIPEDCLERCLEFIQGKANNCALGVKMIDGSGQFLKESKRSFPYPGTSFYKLTGLARLFPRSPVLARYHLGHLDENENHEVDVLAGAFMMLPRKILEVVKGFDEDFFMYGEDVDLSFRVQKAGFVNFYFAETAIIHFKGESTKKGSLNYVRLFYRAMNIFVKKHYRSARAGLFNVFIYVAIGLRAAMAAAARFLKWIGLPVIDTFIILLSFYAVKVLWSVYIRQEVNYSPNVLLIALPVFAALFLITSWLTGLYDSNYKQSRLNKSTGIAMLVILAFYSLLPESLRFSRGILLFGSLAAFVLMTLTRIILLKWRVIEKVPAKEHNKEMVVVGNQAEYEALLSFFESSALKEKIFGRIEVEGPIQNETPGNLQDLSYVLKLYPVKKIILCHGQLSFKEIIAMLPIIPFHISVRFFSPELKSIIGSDDSNAAGDYMADDSPGFYLDKTVHRRDKRLLDVAVSVIFLLSFPIHIFIKRRFYPFIKNTFLVLGARKTWVGYAGTGKELPSLKTGILTTTGLPAIRNEIPEKTLNTTDYLYAQNYEVMADLRLIWENYRYLS